MKLKKKDLKFPKQLNHWMKRHGFISEMRCTYRYSYNQDWERFDGKTGEWVPFTKRVTVVRKLRNPLSEDMLFINPKTGYRLRLGYWFLKDLGKPCETQLGAQDFDRWANSIEKVEQRVPFTQKECDDILKALGVANPKISGDLKWATTTKH